MFLPSKRVFLRNTGMTPEDGEPAVEAAERASEAEKWGDPTEIRTGR